eukprot:6969955-Prymnesium_polylepis.1
MAAERIVLEHLSRTARVRGASVRRNSGMNRVICPFFLARDWFSGVSAQCGSFLTGNVVQP